MQTKADDYGKTIQKAFTIATIREFWKYYQHMVRPSRLKENDNIYMFKAGIHPSWEAPENKGGGCLKVKLKKQRSNRQWEDILLATISPDNKLIDNINGLRLKIKEKGDEVEIWLPEIREEGRLGQIKDYLRRYVFGDEEAPSFDYKSF